MQPLFIFSLQRTGSTLLQRMLATNPEIATVSETYILLPLVYAEKDRGAYAEYGHYVVSMALQDFQQRLPNKRADFQEEIRNFVISLYRKAARKDVTYFLDKTPAYCFIVEEIIELFPDAKFIFLWRNPLGTIASTIHSLPYYHKWNLFNKWDAYLFKGLEKLVASYTKHADIACAVRYEDLINNPEEESKRLFEYLGLDYIPGSIDEFHNVKLISGHVGDQQGVAAYKSVSSEPLQKWRKTINNPVRKIWCRRYLNWIGRERLAVMGYDLDDLLSQLTAVPLTLRHTLADLFWMCFGIAYRLTEFRLSRHKLQDWRRGQRIYIHT